MGWVISLVILVAIAFTRPSIEECEMMIIASAIFAVAGSLGAIATKIGSTSKAKGEDEDAESK